MFHFSLANEADHGQFAVARQTHQKKENFKKNKVLASQHLPTQPLPILLHLSPYVAPRCGKVRTQRPVEALQIFTDSELKDINLGSCPSASADLFGGAWDSVEVGRLV